MFVIFIEPCLGGLVAHIVQMLQKSPFSVEFAGRAQRFQLPLRIDAVEERILEFLALEGFRFDELLQKGNGALPVAGAIGGMLAPAIIFFLLNPSGPASAGWGVPIATDIAFAVGILVSLAWRIPRNLIIFLTALAIANDLGAVLVIALFYTETINMILLGLALGLVCILVLCNRGGVRHTLPYAVIAVFLWLALLKSGVHVTLTGVILSVTIPARPVFTSHQFNELLDELGTASRSVVSDHEGLNAPPSITRMYSIAQSLEQASSAVQSPQQRMEHRLSPWVTFGVIPLFAMANAGIDVFAIPFRQVIFHSVTAEVVLGSVLGKFFGITGFSWLTVKLGFARLPPGVDWRHIIGAAWLGGIGFTMSFFIAQLAFADRPSLFKEARIGIITASVIAATVGLAWLYLNARKSAVTG